MGVKYNHTKFEPETQQAGNGIRKWRTSVSKSVKNGQKMPFFARHEKVQLEKVCKKGAFQGRFCGILGPKRGR